jgi:hypothetical protein
MQRMQILSLMADVFPIIVAAPAGQILTHLAQAVQFFLLTRGLGEVCSRTYFTMPRGVCFIAVR